MYRFAKLLHNTFGVNIMHIAIEINTDLTISSLTDLPKLKLLMESLNMKINKSELARKFKVDIVERLINIYKYINQIQKENGIIQSINIKIQLKNYYQINK